MDAKAWLVPLVFGLLGTAGAYGLHALQPEPTTPAEPFASPAASIDGLRFGINGVEVAELTLYVFKTGDRLLASNAPANETARFTLDGDFQPLPPITLDLGNGTKQPGTMRLPASLASFAAPIRENLTGRASGDVVDLTVTQHPWLDLLGPLRVVARIDRLLPPLQAAPMPEPS
ncbi:MAG: hypothetical protein AABX89_04615 [Candidatus Thermoplasmatota archaeon]